VGINMPDGAQEGSYGSCGDGMITREYHIVEERGEAG
jgi:hypothetical protein